MKINTAINFQGITVEGFVEDDRLTLKRIFDSNHPIEELGKEDVDGLIKELQKVYSTMTQIEKQIKPSKKHDAGIQNPINAGQQAITRPF